MNAEEHTEVLALCGRDSAAAPAVEAFLQAQGLTDAHWYSPRDADDVDRLVRTGTVQRVVFPKVSDFVQTLWDADVDFDRWLAAGTHLDFVDSPGPTPHDVVATVFTACARCRRRHRRRQLIAAFILTAAALAAAFVLIWLSA